MTKDSMKELRDSYRFPGFTPARFVKPHSKDPRGVVIEMSRRQKGGAVGFAGRGVGATMSVESLSGTWTAGDAMSTFGFR